MEQVIDCAKELSTDQLLCSPSERGRAMGETRDICSFVRPCVRIGVDALRSWGWYPWWTECGRRSYEMIPYVRWMISADELESQDGPFLAVSHARRDGAALPR